MTQNKNLQGVLLGIVAFLSYSVGDVFLKFIGRSDMPSVQAIFLISLVSTLFLCLPSMARGQAALLWPKRKGVLFLLGLVSVIGALAGLFAFAELPMTTVYIAYFTSPLIISLYGRIFLKEPMGHKRTFYLVASFAGALFALNPLGVHMTNTSLWAWIILPLLPLTFSAFALFLRVLRETETPQVLASTNPLMRVIFLLPIAILVWKSVSAEQMIFILFIGVFEGMANILIARAMKQAPVTIVAPLHYTQLVYGVIFGYLFWADTPAWYVVVGSLVVIVAGVAAARLNTSPSANVLALAQE